MNKQDMFDYVVRALKAQGYERSAKKREGCNDLCMYRNPDGLKCAAGHLITDEEYDPEMEGKKIGPLSNRWTLKNINQENVFFVNGLQTAHDNGETPEKMERNLRAVGTRNNLTWPN